MPRTEYAINKPALAMQGLRGLLAHGLLAISGLIQQAEGGNRAGQGFLQSPCGHVLGLGLALADCVTAAAEGGVPEQVLAVTSYRAFALLRARAASGAPACARVGQRRSGRVSRETGVCCPHAWERVCV
jgi:hypothetical protein